MKTSPGGGSVFSHLTRDTADECLRQLIHDPLPNWETLRPWIFCPPSQQEEITPWVLSRLAGVHMYWSLAGANGEVPPWRLEFLSPVIIPSPARSIISELTTRRAPLPAPDVTMQIAGHMGNWLRSTTRLTPLVQRNGYALLGRMAQVMLYGDHAPGSRLLRDELLFRYRQTAPVVLQQDILQHLTDYWLTGLRPGTQMSDDELFYGLFFLRQEVARISPLRSLAGYHYLRLSEAVRQFRPELSTSVPYREDMYTAVNAGWETLPRLRETGLSGLLEALEQKRQEWNANPLLTRLLELKPEYIENQKEAWKQVLAGLVEWSCLPEVGCHHPSARSQVSQFIAQVRESGLLPDQCAQWLVRLSPSVVPTSPSPGPSCTMKLSPNITS